MTRPIFPRNNWYDGQNIDENDMDLEQTAVFGTIANNTDFISGSGVEQEFSVQRVLFDSESVPTAIENLLTSENFDGEPIFPQDSFGNTVYSQPSDSNEGIQLEVEVSGASLDGTPKLRVYIFGLIFGGKFTQEVLTFEDNDSQFTRNYFTEIIAIMTQDFFGNQNTIVDGVASRNAGGRLRILESTAMSVARDFIMAEQVAEPNQNYVNFKPATLAKTLDIVLEEIADSAQQNVDDLRINTTSSDERVLGANSSTGLIIGQKFQATTDNIQKVTILLAVERNNFALPGEEFNWSGDIVVGIRRLQTTTTCPTDIVPDTAIEFDPEPAPIAEVSFDRQELAALGVSLTDTPQEVDFVFTQSLLANPNVEPSIVPGQYYMLTIRRAGNISVGNIVLQEAANTTPTTNTNVDNQRLSVFSQNSWTDVPESDLWYRIFTNAIRITDGTAFDNGIQITSPKTQENLANGLTEPFVNGNYSLVDVSQTANNYVIVQQSNSFTTPEVQPSTGNLIFSRISDAPVVSVLSEDNLTTLLDSGNETIILGSVTDTNPVDNPTIEGRTEFPGLVRTNTFTIISPNSDILINNLVGSILTPNVNEGDLQYRIIRADVFNDAYGDVDANGVIDLNDVARAQELDGYSKGLDAGSVPSIEQRNAILNNTVTIEEIIRADVTSNNIINIFDAQLIQQNIALGTAFPSGSNLTRVVLTVENLVNPLTTTPNIIGNDPVFNNVPFEPVNFRIDFVPLWQPNNVKITDLRRFIPKTFTEVDSSDILNEPRTGGKNISFIPGDLLLGGNILNVDGTTYSLDYEVGTITIDLPEGETQGEVDIFNNFIRTNFRFFDGSAIPSSALDNNQVIVSTAIKSFVKDLDGYDFESVDGYNAIDEAVAINFIPTSGILRIRAKNIRNVATRPELRTKIILTVHMKKAGFRNGVQTVTASRLNELLTPV